MLALRGTRNPVPECALPDMLDCRPDVTVCVLRREVYARYA